MYYRHKRKFKERKLWCFDINTIKNTVLIMKTDRRKSCSNNNLTISCIDSAVTDCLLSNSNV
jgi:hypothetical protein